MRSTVISGLFFLHVLLFLLKSCKSSPSNLEQRNSTVDAKTAKLDRAD